MYSAATLPTESHHEHKTTETRLRRLADREGYRLLKSRSRDPQALDFGLYTLIDVQTGGAVNPALAGRWTCSWDIEDVEAFLAEPKAA